MYTVSLPVALLRNNRAWRYIALALALCPQSISHFLSSISFFIGVWTTDQTLSFFVFINFLLLGDALPCGTRTHGVQLPIRTSSERLARSLRARPVFLGPAYCLWGIGNSANRACSFSHSYISPPTRIQNPLTITAVGPQHINLRYHLRSRMADHALRPRGDDSGYSAHVCGRKLGLRSPLPGRCGGYHRPAA